MSIRALNWAAGVLDRYDLPRLDRFVLMILAHHHNDKTGECSPATATLAHRMGCSRQSASAAIRRLKDAGLIRVQQRRQGNKQASNQHVLFGTPREGLRVNPALRSTAVSASSRGDAETLPVRVKRALHNRGEEKDRGKRSATEKPQASKTGASDDGKNATTEAAPPAPQTEPEPRRSRTVPKDAEKTPARAEPLRTPPLRVIHGGG